MKVMFKTQGQSHYVKERGFPCPEWKLPLPRKGEAVQLYATYLGDTSELELILKGDLTLCHFSVERVTYREDADHVDILLSFVVPVLKD